MFLLANYHALQTPSTVASAYVIKYHGKAIQAAVSFKIHAIAFLRLGYTLRHKISPRLCVLQRLETCHFQWCQWLLYLLRAFTIILIKVLREQIHWQRVRLFLRSSQHKVDVSVGFIPTISVMVGGH